MARTEKKYTYKQISITPQPRGGIESFYQYVNSNLKYPNEARTRQVQGKVFIEFIVDIDGYLKDFKVHPGLGFGCDDEAVRVLRRSSRWKPGEHRDKQVRVRMILPITFKLT